MRSKILLITTYLIAAPVCVGQLFINVTNSQSKDRQGQEIAALRLLGKAGKGKFNNSCSSLFAGLATQDTIRKWLEQKDYAGKLHETAKRLLNRARTAPFKPYTFQLNNLLQ